MKKRKSGCVVMGDLPTWRNGLIVMGGLPKKKHGEMDGEGAKAHSKRGRVRKRTTKG